MTVEPHPGIDAWTRIVRQEAATPVSLRAPVLLGLATLVLGVGGFVGWATSAHVAAASVAAGRVVPDGRVKTVTHFEGGHARRHSRP